MTQCASYLGVRIVRAELIVEGEFDQRGKFGLADIPAKSIHVVEALPAPPDSIEKPNEFIRGTRGVQEAIDEVRRKTAGQVRYVGEWHSHPSKASARPSPIDTLQIDWLAALMDMDSMPALMMIAADAELAIIFANQEAAPSPPAGAGDTR